MLVEIYNASDVKQGTISTVQSWSNSAKLDRAGAFSFTMPSTDPNAALVVAKRVAKCYRIVGGTRQLVGAGVIDSKSMTIETGKRSPSLIVSGSDLLRELTNTSVGFLEITDGSGSGATTAPADIIAFAQAGWTLDVVTGYNSTATSVYAGFAGESVLSAFAKVSEKIGEHFRIGDGRKIVWMREDQTDSGIKAIQGFSPEATKIATVCLITDIEIVEETFDLVTRIYPYGAGNGRARISLETTTQAAPAGYTLDTTNNYLQITAPHTAYGLIERYVSFKDIAPISNTDADVQAASDILFEAAKVYLDNNSQIQSTYSLSVAGLDAIVYPGNTIRVVYREYRPGYKAIDIDTDLVILEVRTEITDNRVRVVGLTVSTVSQWPVSDAEIVSEQIGESRIFESHPQLSASIDTISYRDPMDDVKDAVFRFWMGAEITTLNQVLVRFRIDPLRSTVKSIAGASTTTSSGGGSTSGSGGSATPTSSSGGSSTPTSSSGGSSTPTSATQSTNHTHGLSIPNGTISNNIGFNSLGAVVTDRASITVYAPVQNNTVNHTHTVTIGNHTHTVTIAGHTHDVTIAAHTHTTPNHTHDLTPNITTVYGIFEESGANTLVIANLTITVNGGADQSGSVTDIGNGWYELDITSELINSATLRPTQENNDITFATATAKTAQITSQISVRSVIQAIANI